jgi:DNA-binding SARP family transcriptional activator
MTENLVISLLGQIEISYDGMSVTQLTGKTLALLSYLAVTGDPLPRPALAGLLWGGMPESNARANLSKSLSTLRRQFAPHLLITRQTVGFDRESDYWLDVEAFESHLRGLGTDPDVEALQQAIQLYRGDFLEPLYVRDALEFEQWVLTQRVRLRELALQSLYALADHFSNQGATGREKAIAYNAHLLRLEPWREEAHRQMMMLLALNGQRGAALAQFGNCR